MKYVIKVMLLWAVSIVTTAWVLRDTRLFTILAPVYAICMIGSITIVRRAVTRKNP